MTGKGRVLRCIFRFACDAKDVFFAALVLHRMLATTGGRTAAGSRGTSGLPRQDSNRACTDTESRLARRWSAITGFHTEGLELRISPIGSMHDISGTLKWINVCS